MKKTVTIIESQSHLPTWKRVHNGLRWEDMPCVDVTLKRLNFCLFVRGLYDPDLEPVTDEDSGLDEEGLATAKRDSQGRVLQKAGRVRYGSIQGSLSPKATELAVAKAKADAASNDARLRQQGELLLKWCSAKKQPGFTRAYYVADPSAHSALLRSQGKGRGLKGPLRQVSLDRIARTFEKLKQEGWKV
jgi:hypothetical protein